MKKFLSLIVVLVCVLSLHAQDIVASLDDAQSSYSSGQPLEARDNLQQALIDLNNLIGKEILELMPNTLGGLDANVEEDDIIGGTGFAGLMVSRIYESDDSKNIKVNLVNESPMLAMVNTFLNNSVLSGLMGSQTGQKKVTISGYKGMLEKRDGEEGPIGYTMNVPLGDSLFTFETTGFESEDDVVSMAQQLNLDKIAAMLK